MGKYHAKTLLNSPKPWRTWRLPSGKAKRLWRLVFCFFYLSVMMKYLGINRQVRQVRQGRKVLESFLLSFHHIP